MGTTGKLRLTGIAGWIAVRMVLNEAHLVYCQDM